MFDRKRRLRKFQFNYGKSISRYPTSKTMLPKRKNPLFQKIRRLTFLIATLAGLILVIYFTAFSNYFLVEDINIPSADIANENLNLELKKALQNQIGKNLIFLDTGDLETEIIKRFPELQEIKINKDYPRNIEVEIMPFPMVANLINESSNLKKSYIINEIGVVVKEDFENTALPYIRIKSDEPLNTKNAVIERAKLKYILESMTYFKAQLGLNIVEALYKETAREVHLLTEKNFYVWLDIQVPFENQLKKLKKALVKLDIYHENLEYIDLRIAGENGDKIIYKRR